MNWFLIVNDDKFKTEFKNFLKQNDKAVLMKIEANKLFNNVESILNSPQNTSQTELIAVNSSNQIHILKIKDIIHCQSNQNYTQFHLLDGKKLTATKTLKQFENILIQHDFMRIHQSHLVNLNYIDKYVKGVGGYLVMSDGTELPVAARKKEYLLKEFEKL